jgi:hypothetical protein
MLLPHVVAEDEWELEAELRWGKEGHPKRFLLSPADGLVSHARGSSSQLEEVNTLATSFARLDGPWVIDNTASIVRVRDGIWVPDLMFSHRNTGAAYMEVMGYWSRDAVFRRLDQLGKPNVQSLLAQQRLRIHPEVADDRFPDASSCTSKPSVPKRSSKPSTPCSLPRLPLRPQKPKFDDENFVRTNGDRPRANHNARRMYSHTIRKRTTGSLLVCLRDGLRRPPHASISSVRARA